MSKEIHSPKLWKEELDKGDYLKKKNARREIWLQTEQAVIDGKYLILKEEKKIFEVDIQELLQCTRTAERNTLYYNTKFINLKDFSNRGQTVVNIWKMDSIDAAEELMKNGKNPVVLNLANQKIPGGGYKNGAAAQEESLFRRTNYYEFLDKEEKFFYPIAEFGGIYSKNVLVFRDNESTGYAFREEPFYMSFIAQGAYNKPPLTESQRLQKKYERNTEKKIRSILNIGLNHGHDSFVLGAFGCGAFANPPQHVAEIFKKVIKEFDGYFAEIVFAILEDKNSTKFSSAGNFAVFEQTLKPDSLLPQQENIEK